MTWPPGRYWAILTACELNCMAAVAMFRSAARRHPDVDRICLVSESQQGEAMKVLSGLARVAIPPRHIRGGVDRLQTAHAKGLIAQQTQYGYEAMAWADGGILFCRPAPELLMVQPGWPVAVRMPDANRVPHNLLEELRPTFRERCPALSATPDFNGWLLVLRPGDWPHLQSELDRVIDELGCADHPRYFDQPLLNVIFDGKVDLLGPDFNGTEIFDEPPLSSVLLVNFASRPKPWMPEYPLHEQEHCYRLKHGLGETSAIRLAAARARIWLNTLRRELSRILRV